MTGSLPRHRLRFRRAHLTRGLPLILVLTAAVTMTPGRGHSAAPPAPTAVTAAVTTPVRIAAAGDIACPPLATPTATTCRQAATARLIARRDVAAVIPLGDTQYDSGQLSEYQASYANSWGAFRDISYPAVGNHEYRTPGAAGFFSYFAGQVPNSRGWYAKNLGRWRIYLLNSNCQIVDCDAQRRWLRRDLEAYPRRCSLAAMHHPRFSSGEHGNSADAARLWPTLDAYQVDLVLAGHDHDYERFAPLHTSGTVATDGLRSFVVGTGGRSFYAFGSVQPGSRARVGHVMGALFLSLGDGSYSWRFRGLDGTIHDSGRASCVR